MWTEPIYDRTLTDVNFAAANRNNAEHLKGARNYTDFQRIADNMRYIVDVFRQFEFFAPELQSKEFWNVGDVIAMSEIEKIKSDVLALRSAGFILPDTPETPNLPYTHYQKMNDIEKILFDIETFIHNFAKSQFMSGEIMAGEATT